MTNEKIDDRVGVVVIGRNEGKRLPQCLHSVLKQTTRVVYVDSGSTDGSPDLARSLNIAVLELDPTLPFSMARGRNTGFEYLVRQNPELDLVQFVDGDCELVSGWIDWARRQLEQSPRVAVVCGRRRERFPQVSLYNRLCDIEWNTPVGQAQSCGGDALIRVEAFRQASGFNPTLIAGEEPELCLRLRQQGWQILRLEAEMALHDARLSHFGQWWQRMVRAGYAYAEGSWLHGHEPEHHYRHESRSIWFWGLFLPLFILGLLRRSRSLSLILLSGYPWLALRVYRHTRQRDFSPADAALYAGACVVGKFPQALGQIRFHFNRLLGRQGKLIEYD